MVSRQDLANYCDQLLDAHAVQDYCPNGLQVEGKLDINRLITGVTASQAIVEQAIAERADAILVHHGYFWKNEATVICGTKRSRLRALLANDINLLVYHLPLDLHSEFGNNMQLAKRLDFRVQQRVTVDNIDGLLWIGELNQPLSGTEFATYLWQQLLREPLHVAGSTKVVKRIAWCTGAAEGLIETAAAWD